MTGDCRDALVWLCFYFFSIGATSISDIPLFASLASRFGILVSVLNMKLGRLATPDYGMSMSRILQVLAIAG